MKIAILGSGRVGSAIAFYFSCQKCFNEIVIIDMDRNQLVYAQKLLKNTDRNIFVQVNLSEKNKLYSILKDCSFINIAMPWPITKYVIEVAVELGIPLVSVTRPNYNDYEYIKNLNKSQNHLILLGCGLEPGLTEILANYAAQQFDVIEEIHVKCGGIPQNPSPPLYYKIIFGSSLSVDMRDTYEINESILKKVPRFSNIEIVYLDKIGKLEAWHDGLLPWIMETSSLKKIKKYTQKTLRWPGFSNAICLLRDLGFLKNDSIKIDNQDIVVRKFTDAVLKPLIEFSEKDRDTVILLIQAKGIVNNQKKEFHIKLIDNFDQENNLTAMARTTGYTAGCITKLIIQHGIKNHYLLSPHELMSGKMCLMLLEQLAKCQISIQMDWRIADGE